MTRNKGRKITHVHWHVSVTKRKLTLGAELLSLEKYEIGKDFSGMVR